MLRLTKILDAADRRAGAGVLTLGFGDRRRSRLRARLDDGREAALLLPRGTILRDGDRLAAPDGGEVVTVRAAAEALSLARARDELLLVRGAYHLGNRHVPVEIGSGWLAYQHDHVLDGLVAELGLEVETRMAAFEPEAGGYGRAPAGQTGRHGHHHHDPDGDPLAHHHHDR